MLFMEFYQANDLLFIRVSRFLFWHKDSRQQNVHDSDKYNLNVQQQKPIYVTFLLQYKK